MADMLYAYCEFMLRAQGEISVNVTAKTINK